MLVHPQGLIITGYHPIKLNGKWVFPNTNENFKLEHINIESVYSIGLEFGTSFLVNGVDVIGIGHGITKDPVASHPYFGTNQVIQDIFELSSDGYCVIDIDQINRDPQTMLVNKISKKLIN